MVPIVLLAFLAGAALIFGVNLLYADLRRARAEKLQALVQQESRLIQRERAQSSLANQHLYELAAMGGDLGQRKTFKERVTLFFEQAGVKLAPSQIAMFAALALAVSTPLVWLVTRSWPVAVMAGLACSVVPALYVAEVRRRRMRKLLTQLPEAFDLISRMMRAGRTFPQAMQTTAEDASSPLAEEFGFCSDQQQLGMSPNAALRDLARRTGLLEIKIFVLAVSIHRQTGGNLSDLLEKLSDIIRARLRTEGMIRSLTAEGRMQIYVLTALPLLALLVMSLVSPQHAAQLYARPWLLAVTGAGMFGGLVWMNRILNFAY